MGTRRRPGDGVVVGRLPQGGDRSVRRRRSTASPTCRGSAGSTSFIALALVAVGLSLMLGLFTQTGCVGALALLSLFYVSSIPVGLPEARAEGTYLFVNKNLIEAAAVLVLLSFRTGRIAGLDGLWRPRRAPTPPPLDLGEPREVTL